MASFKSGLLWGALFGGLAGLMNAPKSGKETRDDLKAYLDMATEDVNDVRYKVDNLKTSIQRLSTEGLDSLLEATQDIQVALKHFEEESSPRIRRIEEKAENLSRTLDDTIKSN